MEGSNTTSFLFGKNINEKGKMIVMKDDVDEMNNTCVVVVGKHD